MKMYNLANNKQFTVLCEKVYDGMANSEDLDQTAL